MPEALEMAGAGVRVIIAVLAWIAFAIFLLICLPFMGLGWLSYRLGWVE